MPLTALEIVYRKLAVARAQVELLEQLYADIEGEQEPAQPAAGGHAEEDEEPPAAPAKKKPAAGRPERPAGEAVKANVPAVLAALKGGPLSTGDIRKALGNWSPQKLNSVFEVFGSPSANGQALFEKEDPDNRLSKWRLTARGKKEAEQGEA